MTKDEALDLALEALEHMLEDAKQERLTVEYWNECVDAITAIKQALAAPVQEPVAWMFEDDEDNGHKTFRQTPPSPEAIAYLAKWNRPAWVPLYTTPPAAQPAPVQQSRSDVEPVAWMYWQSCLNDDGTQTAPWVQRYSKFKPPESVINKEITPLYTTPPAAQRQWVGLTTDEMKEVADRYHLKPPNVPVAFRAIEAKLKEKNHG